MSNLTSNTLNKTFGFVWVLKEDVRCDVGLTNLRFVSGFVKDVKKSKVKGVSKINKINKKGFF